MAIKGSNDNVWDAFHGPNMGYVEEQYDLYLDDPDAVDETLRHMFDEHGAPTWVSQSLVNHQLVSQRHQQLIYKS